MGFRCRSRDAAWSRSAVTLLVLAASRALAIGSNESDPDRLWRSIQSDSAPEDSTVPTSSMERLCRFGRRLKTTGS